MFLQIKSFRMLSQWETTGEELLEELLLVNQSDSFRTELLKVYITKNVPYVWLKVIMVNSCLACPEYYLLNLVK